MTTNRQRQVNIPIIPPDPDDLIIFELIKPELENMYRNRPNKVVNMLTMLAASSGIGILCGLFFSGKLVFGATITIDWIVFVALLFAILCLFGAGISFWNIYQKEKNTESIYERIFARMNAQLQEKKEQKNKAA